VHDHPRTRRAAKEQQAETDNLKGWPSGELFFDSADFTSTASVQNRKPKKKIAQKNYW
jgi:hypothetical protein